jgi:hypothetical protein
LAEPGEMIMKRNTGRLLVWGGAALVAAYAADSGLMARAATPGFTLRVEPPAELGAGLAVSPGSGSEELAFTSRFGVAGSFSIDHTGSKSDVMPRMRWSRPLGSTLAGAVVSSDGWTFGITGGYGGDDNGSGTALLTPGGARARSGWSTGLEYDFGPWQLGGYYQFSHSDMGFTPAGQVESGYGLGANYNVAPGLSLFSEAFFYTDGLGRAPLAASQTGGSGNSSLKSQTGKLYVIGTHLEW